MKGDFSKLALLTEENLTGVLHQQGRVLLDQDWNAARFIAARLREGLGRDVIGTAVAAVPAEAPDSFRVTRAEATATGVSVTLTPGRVWVDGLEVELESAAAIVLPAAYYGPPVQALHDTATINGERDAVILEVWEEALSAFQDPRNLLEPALGGPDTTERSQLNFALRLYRLGSEEECCCISTQLATDPSTLGKLTVTPSPVVVIGGDCPLDTGGGYTGLEHYLYRIEIADADSAGHARFKWSRFNGGLVGRGRINTAGDEITLVANQQMVNNCGLTSFYLEALTQPSAHQPWQIKFTARATLNTAGSLSLSQTTGTWPAASGVPVFIRLWDGVKKIADFTTAAELENGIQLHFDAPTGSNYRPGDYWTFPARTAGVDFDPSVWPAHAPPEGVVYHRAPLAEIAWPGAAPATASAPSHIRDCRRPFPSLTRLPGCCAFTVGDGTSSSGDFDSIEEALEHLPEAGGILCVLPGMHKANVRLSRRHDVEIRGCGSHTIVVPRPRTRQEPVFHVLNSQRIRITGLDVTTLEGTAILIEGAEPGDVSNIEIASNGIIAGRNGIVAANGAGISINHNRIRVIDKAEAGEAIVLMAEGACIERNDVGVMPAETNVPPENETPARPRPEDPCADPEEIYRRRRWITDYRDRAFFTDWPAPQKPYQALGGIRLSGGGERVRVIENRINGGAGDGICLGGSIVLAAASQEQPVPEVPVRVSAGGITGAVWVDNKPANDVVVSLRRSDGEKEYFAVSREDGLFAVNDAAFPAGDYKMRVESPGYQIKRAREREASRTLPQRLIAIELEPRKTASREIQGRTMAELVIAGNHIAYMGLSGIGTVGATADTGRPVMTVKLDLSILSQFGIPIFQIEVHGNYIHHCLRNPFDEALLRLTALRGLGGISLGICDEVVLSANRIEHNGLSHVTPVTGIFAALVDHIEIRDNALHENGPYDSATDQQPRPGIRGGIVVTAVALVDAGESEPAGLALAPGQPAARISGNVVRQPAGRALTLLAYGPVSVQDNSLSSERRGGVLDHLGGAVLILNLATRENMVRPGGGTLYAGNHVRVGRPSDSVYGQIVFSGADLGYHGNQADYLGKGLALTDKLSFFINTFLFGRSLRAGDNCFVEGAVPEGAPVASLLSLGAMNNTSDNQGDHCIFVMKTGAMPAVDAPNQVHDTTWCRRLIDGFEKTLTERRLDSYGQ